MSWITDLEYTFRYTCPNNHATFINSKDGSDEMREKDVTCNECNEKAKYAGFEPLRLGITTQVEYEQNGRKAMAIRDKDGNMSYVSKTRLNYQKTGRIENQYSEGYKRKLQDEKQEQLLKSEASKGNAKVSEASAQSHMEEMVKSLPDGEYYSDGEEIVGGVDNN